MKTKMLLFLFQLVGMSLYSQYSPGFTKIAQSVELKQLGQHQIFTGNNLGAISFPIGGFGAGLLQMNGIGERHIWQINNNFTAYPSPTSFFAVAAQKEGSPMIIRAVQSSSVGNFKGMDSNTFSGEYPFAWYDYTSTELPVTVKMEAYSPFIPMDLKNSSIPCGIFTLTAKNTSDKVVSVNFLASQQNFAGVSGFLQTGNLIADFEGDDYAGWSSTGTAFGSRPSKGSVGIQTLSNYIGTGLVNTYDNGGTGSDVPIGTLTSPTILITKKNVYFRIGGGNSALLNFNMLVNGKVVRSATGSNSDAMRGVYWNVSEYLNSNVVFQIVDNATGGWGHIAVDYILQTDDSSTPIGLGVGLHKNNIVVDGNQKMLVMSTTKPTTDKNYGSLTLFSLENADNVQCATSYNSLDELYTDFSDGNLTNNNSEITTGTGIGLNAALATPFTLQPGETKSITYVLTWNFPNATHGTGNWTASGNYYTNWWNSSQASASYIRDNYTYLSGKTKAYHASVYASNMPVWLLDRLTSQTANLRTKVFFWGKTGPAPFGSKGYVGGWEGTYPNDGYCSGNSSHVFQYAQSHARLFPELGKILRNEAYGVQKANGGIGLRHYADQTVPIDGQCGGILESYREHLLSKDSTWLKLYYPSIKKAMDYVITTWDSDEDGMLSGIQHNTLDCDIDGTSSWAGSLYLAALSASVKMANLQNDVISQTRYQKIWDVGSINQNISLWNGDYYEQISNTIQNSNGTNNYLTGSSIDQLLGCWWAKQLDLPSPYPLDRVKTALQSLIKINYIDDFKYWDIDQFYKLGIDRQWRRFVSDGDGGLVVLNWPATKTRLKFPLFYNTEVMTGFEYSAAAAMAQVGLIDEGLTIMKTVQKRYDGTLRTGLAQDCWGYSGNPFGDDEAGKFYVRAMSNWSMLLALQGFIYDGPRQKIGFKPQWMPADHVSFFTSAEAWGNFSQRRNGTLQTNSISVLHGNLSVKTLLLEIPEGLNNPSCTLNINGTNQPASFIITGRQIIFTFPSSIVLNENDVLNVRMDVFNSILENKKKTSGIILYPNPSSLEFNISLQGEENTFDLKVINETGVIVLKDRQKSNTSKTVDIHNWPKGVYVIQLSSNKEIYTKKFVKK